MHDRSIEEKHSANRDVVPQFWDARTPATAQPWEGIFPFDLRTISMAISSDCS